MTKTRKTGETCRDAGNVSTDEFKGEIIKDMDDMHWAEVGESECLAENLCDNDSEFEDDFINDGETSTSFSLEECMNEFRARRIRRTSLSYHRQENEAVERIESSKNCQETAERELINQNLCNKEQERKCKPCQNGFCYCFTSDSGDGGYNFDNINPIKQTRYYRRNKLQCKQVPNLDNKIYKNLRSRGIEQDDFSHVQKSPDRKTNTNTSKRTMASKKQLTAISSLETSSKDAPLIQIIQELRENCVISKVKVNKYKIQSSQKNVKFKDQTKSTNKRPTEKKFYPFETEVHTPTAPTLEKFSELDKFQNGYNDKLSQLERRKKCYQCSDKRRGSGGGQLLQKRLSNSQFNYKPRNIKEPPPKPPRSIRVDDDQCCLSSSSTSPSVRDAERVVDNFLKKKGYTLRNTDNKNVKTEVACDEGKATTQNKAPKSIRTQTESALPTYPTLCDMNRVVDSKISPIYGINIRPMSENVSKVRSIGWNETKINDMLNYDANSTPKEFCSTDTQAEPQHNPGCDVIGNTNTIGWQIPPKINLDTVDGFMRHNLASNFDNKNTPIKTKIMSPPKKETTRKFMWSEQLKNLSPWSNKHNTNVVRESNTNSRSFIKSSKMKILRLVSPKKENKYRRNFVTKRTPHRTIGVQTSNKSIPSSQHNIHDTRECSSHSQSPPGSYHSPIQSSTQSQNTTPNVSNEPSQTHFNFSRTIHSPPKKAPRSIQRKLNFPLNCNLIRKEEPLKNGNLCTSSEEHDKKTYRSFNSELDHDVSISKISYILSNIRSKLEANDDQAIRTFLETDNITENPSHGFDRPDSLHYEMHAEYLSPSRKVDDQIIDPIYSEIEDDSILISESPKFDNNAGVKNLNPVKNLEVLYAKVNKNNKQITNRSKSQLMDQRSQIPLAKIIHDSLKNKKIITNVALLPPLPEPPESESGSRTSPTALLHYQSLNNVRVMEHNSPPKNQRMLSKSDLSLHRSEIFLENLCRSELVVHSDIDQVNLEKVNNVPRRSYISIGQPSPNDQVCESSDNGKDLVPNDTISYELPNNYDDVDGLTESIDEYNTTTAGSNLGLSTIIPPSSHNQSTPKKQSFTTKDRTNSYELNIDVEPICISDQLNNSCPTTPYGQCNMRIVTQEHPIHSRSMKELTNYETVKYKKVKTPTGYTNIKNILHSSFRKSKKFIKAEGKRLSASFNFSMNNETGKSNLYRDKQPYTDSILNLESLFCLDESATVNEQIAQTVSICRKLPDLEISTEMVEAERLLLFSTLRRENQQIQLSTVKSTQTMNQKPKMRFFIDDMYLPVQSNLNQDIFFNYFYIVTFECGGVIKSTQSAECINGTALFRDCGIEFSICSELKLNVAQDSSNNVDAVKCNIFMLRLRKISTISNEPKKRTLIDTFTQSPSTTLLSTSSSTSSFNEVVSRFRLHASFSLNASNFIPYEYVHQESTNSDRICIRASSLCTIPLIPQTKYTNLSGQLRLKGRSEVRFPKHKFKGFLNVEDPYTQHNWNRRWCTLDGIFLSVWQDENCLNESPLMVLDLRDTKRNMKMPLTYLARELCARPRSFCLQCTIRKASEDVSTATVFFAAESQDILNDWLNILNIVLDFIATWLN